MKKIFTYLFIIGAFSFLFWNIIKNWEIISRFHWEFNIPNIILLTVFFLLVYITNIFSWHTVTRSLGIKTSFKRNIQIWMVSNLSRLLPGGVWQYSSRVYLLIKSGAPRGSSVAAVTLEGLLNLSLGAAITMASLYFWELPENFTNYRHILWVFLFSPFLIFLLANRKVTGVIAKLLMWFMRRESNNLTALNLPLRWILPLSLVFLGKFLVFGGALFFLARSLLPLEMSTLPIFIGVSSFSWLLGYITVFAPAGLGVTEVSLAALLALYMPFPISALLSVAFRLFLFLSEIIFLSIAFWFLKR